MNDKYFGGVVPEADVAAPNPLRELAEGLYAEYDACMAKVDFTGAAAAVQRLAHRANAYIDETEPFRMAKDPERREELAQVMYNLLETIRILALFFAPFMPNTSAEVFRRLGLGEVGAVEDIKTASKWGQLPFGNRVEKGEPLFPRLDESAITLE